MRIGDWSSDVCSSDLLEPEGLQAHQRQGERSLDDACAGARPVPRRGRHGRDGTLLVQDGDCADGVYLDHLRRHFRLHRADPRQRLYAQDAVGQLRRPQPLRSEEHTSELQSLMRISYAVFCLKIKTEYTQLTN